MKSSRFQVLSESEIREIHERSLEKLSEVGVKVEVKKMRNILADIGCKVDEAKKIVKFPPKVALDYIKKAPREFVMCGADPAAERLIRPDTRVYGGLGTIMVLAAEKIS